MTESRRLSLSGVVDKNLSERYAASSPFPDAPLMSADMPPQTFHGSMHRRLLGLDSTPVVESPEPRTVIGPSRLEVEREEDVGGRTFFFKRSLVQFYRLLSQLDAAGHATDDILAASAFATAPTLLLLLLRACRRLEADVEADTINISLSTLPPTLLDLLTTCAQRVLKSIHRGEFDVDSDTTELLSNFCHQPANHSVLSRLLPVLKSLYKGLLRPKPDSHGPVFDSALPLDPRRVCAVAQCLARRRALTVAGFLDFLTWLDEDCRDEPTDAVCPLPKLRLRSVECHRCSEKSWVLGLAFTTEDEKYFCAEHLTACLETEGTIRVGLPASVKSIRHLVSAASKARMEPQAVAAKPKHDEVLAVILDRCNTLSPGLSLPTPVAELEAPSSAKGVAAVEDKASASVTTTAVQPPEVVVDGNKTITRTRTVTKKAKAPVEDSFMEAHWKAHEAALARPELGTSKTTTGAIGHTSCQTRVQSWLVTSRDAGAGSAGLSLTSAGLVAAGSGVDKPVVHVFEQDDGGLSLMSTSRAISGDVKSIEPSAAKSAKPSVAPCEQPAPVASPVNTRRMSIKRQADVKKVVARATTTPILPKDATAPLSKRATMPDQPKDLAPKKSLGRRVTLKKQSTNQSRPDHKLCHRSPSGFLYGDSPFEL